MIHTIMNVHKHKPKFVMTEWCLWSMIGRYMFSCTSSFLFSVPSILVKILVKYMYYFQGFAALAQNGIYISYHATNSLKMKI